MTARTRIIVTGRVQGVGFRYACILRAESLGLSGSVRNLADRSVEVIAEGDPAQVDELVQWCRTGPPHARINSVESHDEEAVGMTGFKILYEGYP